MAPLVIEEASLLLRSIRTRTLLERVFDEQALRGFAGRCYVAGCEGLRVRSAFCISAGGLVRLCAGTVLRKRLHTYASSPQ